MSLFTKFDIKKWNILKINKKMNLYYLLLNRYGSVGGKLIIGHPNSHSEDPVVREAAFKVFNSSNSESEQLLDDLLESRHKLALTCGFPSYAHR